MSHQITASIEYTLACNKMLDSAASQISKTISDIETTKRNSSKVLDSVLNAEIEKLISEGNELLSQIRAKKISTKKAVYVGAITETRQFLMITNGFYLRTTNLDTSVSSAFKSMMKQSVTPRRDIDEGLSTISDDKLASLIKLLARNPAHSDLSFDELKNKAQVIIDPSLKVNRNLIKESVKEVEKSMECEKLGADVIKNVIGEEEIVSPLEMMNAATSEIMDERLRKSAIQAIVKSISGRGFIVNRSDIRHIKETDTVRIVAKKPAGQTAEFLITLDGRFQYHFQGYEGAACEKDIGPMEKDLEEVYGIKLTDKKTIWQNPDKHNKEHHQAMNVRRDS